MVYETGEQPCNDFKPTKNEYGMNNIHSCIYCDDSWVSFCENCFKDHHKNGYESCKKYDPKKGIWKKE